MLKNLLLKLKNLIKNETTKGSDNDIDKPYYYDWLFHFNPYTNRWYAFNRSNYNHYFNDRESHKKDKPYFYKSKDIKTLLYLIKETENKQNGDS
jgi:hypothetical protein